MTALELPESAAQVARVRQAISPGDVLIDALQIDETRGDLVVFTIRPGESQPPQYHEIDGAAVRTCLVGLESSRERWTGCYIALHQPNVSARDQIRRWQARAVEQRQRLLRHLTTEVLKDLEHEIAAGCIRRLLIAPDGLLHRVPWASLLVREPGSSPRYLIDCCDVHLVPSGTWLADRRAVTQSPRSLQVLAAAPFGVGEPADRSPLRLRDVVESDAVPPSLPGTKQEISALQHLLNRANSRPNAMRHLPAGFTAEDLRHEMANATVLHLATHGQRVPNDHNLLHRYRLLLGEHSHLVLAELYEPWHLVAAPDIVVLSACHLGDTSARGGAALGFGAGFQRLGAGLVLAPLWAVDDGATAKLIANWYTHLLHDGMDVATAWRMAVHDLRQAVAWQDPFFWAGFLPNGDGSIRLTA